MWMTCLPRRSERSEDVLEDGDDCFFPDLKPIGGLYGRGPGTLALDDIHTLV